MPSGDSASSIGPSRQNLLRLWLIRSILLVALIVALAVLREFTAYELLWNPLWALLLAMALLNIALLYRLWLPRPVGEREFFANLLLDIAFLTGVLYLSGGAANPLVSYYLIPLIVSAALLESRFTWALTGISVGCYTVLYFFHQPFALFAMAGHGGMSAHMTGMWINFVFSALLIAWFVARMARSMREQQSAAAAIREEALRDERIVGVAGIAAGAAHELRTPLATMTVLVDELSDQHPDLDADLGLLRQQLQRCEDILGKLVDSATHARERRQSSLAVLVRELIDTWRIARPEVPLRIDIDESAAHIQIVFNQGLNHALLNFLHNAADASPDHVSLKASQEGGQALIVIEDRGAGIPGEIADALGRRFVSRKDGGLGLGVLLGSATIERLDGQVSLHDREGGGTRWEVRLPSTDER